MLSIASLTIHFSQLKDPRTQHSIDHKLIDIIIIIICAVNQFWILDWVRTTGDN